MNRFVAWAELHASKFVVSTLTGLALSLPVALFVAPPAPAQGGHGLVTMYRVGPLSIDNSTDSEVENFAGHPDSVSHFTVPVAGYYYYKTYNYRFPNRGYVAYTFAKISDTWFLEGFASSLQRFHTARGTRAGMSLSEAEHREHLPYSPGCYSGLRRIRGNFELIIEASASRVFDLVVLGPAPQPC